MTPPTGPSLWVDGRVVDVDTPVVTAVDHGLTVGDGLFETLRVVRGQPVFWSRHLRRLHRGLRTIGLEHPDDTAWSELLDRHLRAGTDAVLADRRDQDSRLRLTVTSGPGPSGARRTTRSHRGAALPTVIVAAEPLGPPPGPLSTCTVRFARNERSPLAGVKTTSYGEAAVLLHHATGTGVDEALLADTTGRLSEAVTANVFVSVEGRLRTPGTDAGCLPGIVREVLLESGVAEEADLPVAALTAADEVFLTSATRGVVSVHAVDAHPVPTIDGPLTHAARAAYERAVADDLGGR